MTLQDQLDRITSQLSGLSRTFDHLQAELRQAPPVSDPTEQKLLSVLADFLALKPFADVDPFLELTLRCAMHGVGAGGAGLTLYDPEKNALVFRAAIGDGAAEILGLTVPIEGSRHGLAFLTGEVQAARPLYEGADRAAGSEFRNVLVAPLLVGDEAIGTMSAVNKLQGEQFTPDDMHAYRRFAELAALIVRQGLRGQILEQFSSGSAGAEAEAISGLPLRDDDRLLLQTVQTLVRVAGTRPDRLTKIQQLIALLDEE